MSINENIIGLSQLQEYDKQRQAHLAIELKELDDALVCTFDITKANTTITLKELLGITKTNWGDGTVDANLSHTYTNIGKYICVIKGVTSIGNYAFENWLRLTSVAIGNSVTSIGYEAFDYCSNLTSVVIGDSVESIGKYAFNGCRSLTNVAIPNSVTSIDNYAFCACSSLMSITIPDSVTSIGNNAFTYCSSLTSVEIPDSVTSIGNSAFSGCSSLTSITIPDRVTSIGNSAFYNCRNLTTIQIDGKTPPSLNNTNAIPSNIQKIIVPIESLEAYKTASNWSYYTDKITAIVDTNHMPEVDMNSNLENGEGACSIQQKGEVDEKGAKAIGLGAVAFGGFRGDKPTETPDPIPADDATSDAIADIDTISIASGIQSAVFGAGNRAYGNWNFIAGKDNKTFQKGTFAFGGKNLVGYHGANNDYLFSAAFGELNTVLGRSSLAIGVKNEISVYGEKSIAIGEENDVIHGYSAAVGFGNIVYSDSNYALGHYLKVGKENAKNGLEGQTAVGCYNAVKDETGNAATLFMVGNGTSESDRSNAFEVLRNGSAIIGGLRYDYAKYKVYQNLSITLNETLYEGEYYVNSETGAKYCTIGGVNLIDEALNEIVSSATINNTSYRIEASIDSTDNSLVSLKIKDTYVTIENNAYNGRETSSAEGNQAFAGGGSSHTYGDWGFAFGKDVNSYGKASVAFGGGTQAGDLNNPSEYSFAFAANELTTASKRGSTAFGKSTIADGEYSFATGSNTRAFGTGSFTQGHITTASGMFAMAAGDQTWAFYDGSAAFGQHTKTGRKYQFVTGICNVGKEDTLFEIGNGSSDLNRSNAFEVLKDGRAKVYKAPVEENDVVRLEELNTKFDKTGGTINGDVTIGGNLTVQGTTSAIDVENLRVEDSVIVVNSTGSIPGLSGIAMAAGPTYEGQLTTPAYGIMWSPFTESSNGGAVKLGLGNIDNQTGEFTYMEGEDQCLATIDWSIKGGHLTQWDENLYTLVDAGVSVADLATKEELTNKVTELEAKITELEAKLTALLPRTVEV